MVFVFSFFLANAEPTCFLEFQMVFEAWRGLGSRPDGARGQARSKQEAAKVPSGGRRRQADADICQRLAQEAKFISFPLVL